MIEAILTDIEGTTSSISFVRDVLFPYARDALPDYLARHGGEKPVAELLQKARAAGGVTDDSAEATVALLRRWIDEDRKDTSLKALQGMIWEAGYRRGDFKAHLYEDAYRKLADWHARGVPVYVYSSGSVHAQQLYFAHTDYGDLAGWFAGHFDTRTGAKQSPEAYRAIQRDIGARADTILFLSDVAAELDAAAEAGLRTLQLVREADGTAASGRHTAVASFTDIDV